MWVGQPLHCGIAARNPVCDPRGGKEGGEHTVKILLQVSDL